MNFWFIVAWNFWIAIQVMALVTCAVTDREHRMPNVIDMIFLSFGALLLGLHFDAWMVTCGVYLIGRSVASWRPE